MRDSKMGDWRSLYESQYFLKGKNLYEFLVIQTSESQWSLADGQVRGD